MVGFHRSNLKSDERFDCSCSPCHLSLVLVEVDDLHGSRASVLFRSLTYSSLPCLWAFEKEGSQDLERFVKSREDPRDQGRRNSKILAVRSTCQWRLLQLLERGTRDITWVRDGIMRSFYKIKPHIDRNLLDQNWWKFQPWWVTSCRSLNTRELSLAHFHLVMSWLRRSKNSGGSILG